MRSSTEYSSRKKAQFAHLFLFLLLFLLFDNTTPIYLIDLPWKLGLVLGLDLKLHYFSIFHGE